MPNYTVTQACVCVMELIPDRNFIIKFGSFMPDSCFMGIMI